MQRSAFNSSREDARSFSATLFDSLEQRLLYAVDIAIDAAIQFQKIEGFGTSIETYPNNDPYTNSAWQDMYFRDLGSSMLRIGLLPMVAAGPDNSTTTPITFGTDLAANIAQMNFNFAKLGGSKSMAINGQAAKKLDDFKVIGSIWSPPHWMKTTEVNPYTGASTGIAPFVRGDEQVGGSLIDTASNLEQFGRYVATWVAGWEQATGVPMYSVSIQNELANSPDYSSCVYSYPLFAKAVKAVGEAFAMWGLDTKIQGPEHFGIGNDAERWQADQTISWIKAINDAGAGQYIDSYVVHQYPNGSSPITAAAPRGDTRSAGAWNRLWTGNGTTALPGIKNTGKQLWMTETAEEAATFDGGIHLAAKTQDALIYGNVSAWVYWQTTTETTQLGLYNLTGGADGMTKGDKYAAQRHFFRYIRPDSVRVAATSTNPSVTVSAFKNVDDNTLTSVLINQTATTETVTMRLTNAQVAAFSTYVESTAGNLSAAKPTMTVSNGVATFTLPGRSIVTLQGSTANATVSGTIYIDNDDNGTRGTSDSPFSNVRIYDDVNRNGAYDAASEPSVLSDAAGNYTLGGLVAGTHRIRIVTPNGYRLTQPTAAYYDTTLTNGQFVSVGAFGLSSKGRVSGTLFKDNNKNNTFDNGDAYLGGHKVWIDLDLDGLHDTGEASYTTDVWGFYNFKNLTPGTAYRIRAMPLAGYNITSPAAGYYDLTLTSAQVLTYKSFAYQLP